MRRNTFLLLMLSLSLVVLPCHALMLFFGSEPVAFPSSWPAGLVELLNHEARFTGAHGPIADVRTYYSGDAAQLNSFLADYGAVATDNAVVVLHSGPMRITPRYTPNFGEEPPDPRNADWMLHVAEFFEGRPDVDQFKGEKFRYVVDIWLGGNISLDTLEVPANVEVRSGGEIEAFVESHAAKRRQLGDPGRPAGANK